MFITRFIVDLVSISSCSSSSSFWPERTLCGRATFKRYLGAWTRIRSSRTYSIIEVLSWDATRRSACDRIACSLSPENSDFPTFVKISRVNRNYTELIRIVDFFKLSENLTLGAQKLHSNSENSPIFMVRWVLGGPQQYRGGIPGKTSRPILRERASAALPDFEAYVFQLRIGHLHLHHDRVAVIAAGITSPPGLDITKVWYHDR